MQRPPFVIPSAAKNLAFAQRSGIREQIRDDALRDDGPGFHPHGDPSGLIVSIERNRG